MVPAATAWAIWRALGGSTSGIISAGIADGFWRRRTTPIASGRAAGQTRSQAWVAASERVAQMASRIKDSPSPSSTRRDPLHAQSPDRPGRTLVLVSMPAGASMAHRIASRNDARCCSTPKFRAPSARSWLDLWCAEVRPATSAIPDEREPHLRTAERA